MKRLTLPRRGFDASIPVRYHPASRPAR